MKSMENVNKILGQERSKKFFELRLHKIRQKHPKMKKSKVQNANAREKWRGSAAEKRQFAGRKMR